MDRIATFRAYLRDRPNDRFAMYAIALELKKAGDVDAAEAAFRELLAAHPASGAGHYQLGELYREHGREEEAVAAWRAGLEALEGLDDVEARRSRSEIETALDLLE